MVTVNSIDLKSATRLGATFAGAMAAVWVGVWLLLWFVLSVAGVWGRMNSLIVDITGLDAISGGKFLGVIIGIGLLEFVVWTAMFMLSAYIYNTAANLLGGLKLNIGDAGEAAAPKKASVKVIKK